MARPKATHVVLAVVLLLLVGAVVPPLINVNRYRSDVASAIGRALGRTVSVGSVSLRLLPQPGFALTNLVVADDSSFSAEPLLQADNVNAALRITSLWRGRLEIAKLTLSYPSLNLVRRSDGHWNLESLLERTAHSQAAPTGRIKPQALPRFPYIEVENGRINLKLGQEKKAYALSDADFALWQEADREWRLRLEAQPVRTDDNLSDTGTLKLSGSFGTAPSFADMPLALNLEWEQAQLGQVTRLIYGHDRGWRGSIHADAVLRGTPGKLSVAASADVDGFHRFDLYGGGISLSTRCRAELSSTGHYAREIACRSDAGQGAISANGSIEWVSGMPQYAFKLAAERVPAEQLVAMGRSMKSDWPRNLSVHGLLNALLELRNDPGTGQPVWTGNGNTLNLAVQSDLLNTPLQLGNLAFELDDSTRRPPALSAGGGQVSELSLNVKPFPMFLGAAKAAESRASLSAAGYQLRVQGEAQVRRLLEVAHALGLASPANGITGSGRVDFTVAGGWTGLATPLVTGTVQLHELTAKVDGLVAPVNISSGTVVLTPKVVALRKAKLKIRELPLTFSGWLQKPRGCPLDPKAATPATLAQGQSVCRLTFDLHTKQMALGDLGQLRTPAPERHWYQFLGRRHRKDSVLSAIHASGRITASLLRVRSLKVSNASAELALNDGVLRVTNFRGGLLQGNYRGELQVDFRARTPQYQWHGQVEQVSMESLARLLHQDWHGKAKFAGAISASGWTLPELLASAEGSVAVDWRHGTLGRMALDGEGGAMRLRHFTGDLNLRAGIVSIANSTAEVAEGRFQVTGAASRSDGLQIKLTRASVTGGSSPREAQVYEITGLFSDPQVVPVRPAELPRPLPSSAEVRSRPVALPSIEGERLSTGTRP